MLEDAVGLANIMKPNFTTNPTVQAWTNLTTNGGKRISGPMLVVKGTADQTLTLEGCSRAVNDTVMRFPESRIEYVLLEDVDHTPSLSVGQDTWLRWIGERFDGHSAQLYQGPRMIEHIRPKGTLEEELDFVLEVIPSSETGP